MTDEEIVKAKWPMAVCFRFGQWHEGESFFRVYPQRRYASVDPIGYGSSEDDAWQNAASRVQRDPIEQEEK